HRQPALSGLQPSVRPALAGGCMGVEPTAKVEAPERLERLGIQGVRLNAHASAGQSWTDRWLQAGQRWLSMEAPFSAHPRRCATTGQVSNFGLQVAPVPTLLVYCIDPQGKLQSTRQIRLPRVAFMHDFVLTANHAVFFMTPVRFDVGRALLGLSSPVESIRRAPGVPTEILLVPRDGGAVRRIALDAGFFLFHFFNAFEANDTVVVDGCRMDDFPGGTVDLSDIEAVRRVTLDPGYPTRWRINLSDGTVSTTRLSEIPMELPTIDPRRSAVAHRFGYATARLREGPPVYTGLARIDFTHGTVWTRDFSPDLPGEPMLLPLGDDEGEGVLASVIYRAAEHVSELTLLDPENLQTVARARLPHHQPPGFHGDFQRSDGPG
ncbi:MAG: carotenoid oxygenase family protein, partial [Myxococcota bacterium]